MSAKASDFDVTIIGAGMIGATLACALAELGLKVAVVEAQAPAAFDPQGELELRVSAISVASENLLTNLGLWQQLPAQRLGSYREMQVWNQGGLVHFDAAEVPCDHLGHIVENSLIQWAALNRLAQQSQVRLICPARLERLTQQGRLIALQLSNGESLQTRLLVGADGTPSRVRFLAGIPVFARAYGQRAVVASVQTEYPHRQTAWQRFLRDGPLAFLPLADGRCSIVWSNTEHRAQGLLQLNDDGFRLALAEAMQGALGGITAVSPRLSFPLQLLQAHSYVASRIALVGDAAHTVHPLAGQGANLGFLDVAALAEVLRQGMRDGRDPGDPVLLARYQRWRRGHNLAMSFTFDGFHRLFDNDQMVLRWLRNAGLSMTDRLSGIKRQIMLQASGLSGDLPPLARSAAAITLAPARS